MRKPGRLYASAWVWTVVLLGLLCMPAAHGQGLLRKADAQAQWDQPEIRELTAPFDEARVQSAWVVGEQTLRGMLFYRKRVSRLIPGRAVPLPGAHVYLFPYSEQMAQYAEQYREVIRRQLPHHQGRLRQLQLRTHPEMLKYQLRAETDGYGRFEFQNLPPGRYILYSDPSVVESRNESQAVQTGTLYSYNGWVQTPIYERQNYTAQYNVFTHGHMDLYVAEGQAGPVEVEFELRPVY